MYKKMYLRVQITTVTTRAVGHSPYRYVGKVWMFLGHSSHAVKEEFISSACISEVLMHCVGLSRIAANAARRPRYGWPAALWASLAPAPAPPRTRYSF